MMAALQGNEEYEKGPKKTFVPPTQKSHSVKPPDANLLMENTPGISSPEAEAKRSPPQVSLKKKRKKNKKKAATENGASRDQEKKQKARGKPGEKKRKEKSTLTNEEFEEIFQTVLKKSLQECLESSCVQSTMHSQPDKEQGFTSSATGNENADGEMAIASETPKISSSLDDKVVSEISTLKLDQPVPEPPKKKFNRLSSNKRKKKTESSCVQPRMYSQPDKEPGFTSSATGNENDDGEMAIASETPEISSSLDNKVVSEIRTLKLDQPVPEPPKKKFNRLPLNKRKKKTENEDEKMESIQDGHEHRLEVLQKATIKDPSQIRSQQKEEKNGFGQCLVWVQCSFPKCEKWRRLLGNTDPSVLPDNWSCDQNPDVNYNRCDIPEETWTGCESDVTYASYVPGSIIWAKQYGYPWWPGMVESDPDLGEYFLFASHLDSLPSKYHVTFFGDAVSRAWIPVNMLKNFQELSLELTGVKKCKNKDYNQKLEAAIKMAREAEQTSIQDRVNLFGFWTRYNASDNSGEGKDLMVSPESCLEKEEKDAVEGKENEKKDTTLPGPKPPKIQTKKPKSRGTTDEQGRALKKKTVKKSLESKALLPPAPIMGGEEGQRTSAPDPPGHKKKFKAPGNKALATNLSEEKEVKIVSECPTPPAHHGSYPLVGKEGPGSQEPPVQETVSFPLEDEASSDLDFGQLMEDIGGESEGQGEPQHRDRSEEFLAVLFEE
ncbi:zinc finger CW-type PWWP domain protein 1 isoform X2 [Nannospalax galili]|uniref:zinc finger CW-type PWWP domain protein 1 isoform X2 n=1 Tax=Nannospalax galili TaxID=1026970 RepID=UPI0004ED1E57|nr:zinc finger CW-type PWWP domain protein 1 isoform X2 [Nannospalax galili]XP_008830592.1 zinc finger CW-type PWWP domain protein 1 isoform X2 [Nannospalax galili]